MRFTAELRLVKATKSISNDIIYECRFVTDNPVVLELGSLPADELVVVNIEKERQ